MPVNMGDRMPVIVMGDSLLMDSLGSNLREGLKMDVIRVNAASADLEERLRVIQPDLIVFELDVPRPCSILALLKEQPGTLFLGIDPTFSQVIALHSDWHLIQTLQEFCQLAQTQLNEDTQLEGRR